MADRYERLLAKISEDGERVRQVQPAVKRVQAGGAGQAREGKGQVPHVAVDHVEFPGALEDPRQLEQVEDQVVLGRGAETERARRGSHQTGPRMRVAAREERHLM